MKLTVIVENVIEIVYQFEVNAHEQMHGVEEGLKKQLPVRKNNVLIII